MAKSSPFGNLGKADWGLPFWAAVLTTATLYALGKGTAWLLSFVPLLGTAISLATTPIAAVAGESVYHWKTGMQTHGWGRFVLCLVGTAPGAVLMGSSLLGVVAAACWAAFWLFMLDKVRAQPSLFG